MRFVVGAGYYRADLDDTARIAIGPDELSVTDNETTEHENAYGYGYFNLPLGVSLTAGLSGDRYDGEPEDIRQLNPKAGLTWQLTPDTRLRAAAFRTFARSLISNQTIEPTTVAGFQQYRYEWNGTESWTYGYGLDQRIADAVLAGIEVSRHTPSVPAQEMLPTGELALRKFDIKETSGRAYCYWMPADYAALSAEYSYDRTEPEDGSTPFAHDLKTHRVPLGCRFFLPAGFAPKAQLTYVDQHRFATDPLTGGMAVQSDSFWVLDVGLGYRLPKKTGTLTVEARNLLDQRFEYEELDPLQPVAFRERTLLVKMTWAL
jgi:outer membrane receptor protein involved in Fe transport